MIPLFSSKLILAGNTEFIDTANEYLVGFLDSAGSDGFQFGGGGIVAVAVLISLFGPEKRMIIYGTVVVLIYLW